MKRRILWSLVAFNVLLAVALAMRATGDNQAVAQVRRPADYILIPGEVGGGASAVVYMIDTTNGLLGAMAFDDSRKELNIMPPIELARVFETAGPGGIGGRGGAGGAGAGGGNRGGAGGAGGGGAGGGR
ncbi:MAG TPA: hypothetical protein VER17_17435 [Tepidisphaeraceae bacterium]|nr:hypothetical protein [Tepidisphaeraceae bacterium]